VIRTAHEMGIPCVAVHSTVDKQALHVQIADEAVCIGEAPSSQSYLVIPNIVAAAVSRGCTMLHPGYGFLSENASFVDICKEHGINFIGPSPDSIRVMGDKATARETMKTAGVPTVPGSDGILDSTEEAITVANQIGFPVMIKATAGGGGRGMRLANEPGEFVKLLQQAKASIVIIEYFFIFIQTPFTSFSADRSSSRFVGLAGFWGILQICETKWRQ